MMHGIVRQMPLKAINDSTINFEVKLLFRRSATTVTNLPDSWNSSCEVSGMLAFLIIHLTGYSMCGKANGKKEKSRIG
jgi:hypothetical protein